MTSLELSVQILDILRNTEEPLTGRSIYKILSKEYENLLLGEVASRIWTLQENGKVIVGTDLKVRLI